MHDDSNTSCEIPLSHGGVALVDPADYPILSQYRWFRHTAGYAIRHQTQVNKVRLPMVYMHRQIMQPPPGMQVDHRNGNPLDNRRVNLRLAYPAQQLYNRAPNMRPTRSRFKGVVWHPRGQKWLAQIRQFDRQIYLGIFASEIDAARAYDAAARERFGEFARLNLPEDV